MSPLLFSLSALAEPPPLDVETLGVYRRIADAVSEDGFPEEHWAQENSGMGALAYRYELAFAAYAVAAMAEHTPAFRAPYQRTLEQLIDKMLSEEVWSYWLSASWGGDDPLRPYNIMYSGHLLLMLTWHQRLSGESAYSEDLALEGSEFTTSLDQLALDLNELTLANVDSTGEHYYGISCETGMVFVPCQTPHAYSQLLMDGMEGTDYAAASDLWLDWSRQHMLSQETGTFYAAYYPFEEPPRTDESHVGAYNAWALIFADAVDHDWTVNAYGDFLATYVEEDGWGKGTAIVHNAPGSDDLVSDLGATVFGLVLARELGDQDLYERLLAALDAAMGGRSWSEDGRSFGYDSPMVPTVVANMHLLWALSLDEGSTLRDLAGDTWSAEDFEQPYVADVSNPDAFVTRAFYDSDQLTVTLSGGPGTSEATDVVVANLDPARSYGAWRDGEPFGEVTPGSGTLTLHTGPLGELEQTWVVAEVEGPASVGQGPDLGTPADLPTGCGCSELPESLPWTLLVPLLAVRRRA